MLTFDFFFLKYFLNCFDNIRFKHYICGAYRSSKPDMGAAGGMLT